MDMSGLVPERIQVMGVGVDMSGLVPERIQVMGGGGGGYECSGTRTYPGHGGGGWI